MSDLPTGIRRTPTGYQTYVWRADPTKPKGGYQASKRWPPTATLAAMKAWRQEQKLRGHRPELFADPDEQRGTFADDARDYLQLEKVQRMPTKDQRVQHIEEWIRIFGHRDRTTIQPHEIQRALDTIRARLSAGSANKRRTALMDLWTTLDGRHQANPVKATRPFPEAEPIPRAPELANVLALLKTMRTDTDFALKCRARAMVIAWTGWPHAIVKQLQPTDYPEWKKGRAFVAGRRKGKGARARWLPLLPEAVKALRAFHTADAYGWFSNSTLHKRITATCQAAKLPALRPYDLRHFFLTLVAVTTRDERAVMELGLISTPKIAQRYTAAATDPRVQAAVAELAKRLPALKKAAGRFGRVSGVSASAREPERQQQPRKTLRKSAKVLVGAEGFEPSTPAV